MAYYVIVSRLNGFALDIEGGSKNAGAKVFPWDKHNGDNQVWYDDPATGTIRSKLNGFCLDIEGDQLRVMPFQQGDPNQQWSREGEYIRNRVNHKVVDIFEGNKSKGAKVGMYDAHGGQNQLWNFEFVGGSAPVTAAATQRREFFIVSDMNQKVLDIKGGSKESGASLVMWSKNSPPSKNQLWYTDPQGFIRSALNDMAFAAEASGKSVKTIAYTGDPRQQWSLVDNKKIQNHSGNGECLDIKGDDKDNGAKVISYHYKGSANQHWRFEYVS